MFFKSSRSYTLCRAKRLANAEKEIAQKDLYRHVIVNDDLQTAVNAHISLDTNALLDKAPADVEGNDELMGSFAPGRGGQTTRQCGAGNQETGKAGGRGGGQDSVA